MVCSVTSSLTASKGTIDLKAWLESRPDDLFEVAAITVAELWHGVERAAAQRARRRHYLQTMLAPLPILPYAQQTAFEHARIWAQLEAAGKMIGSLRPDCRRDGPGARQ